MNQNIDYLISYQASHSITGVEMSKLIGVGQYSYYRYLQGIEPKSRVLKRRIELWIENDKGSDYGMSDTEN